MDAAAHPPQFSNSGTAIAYRKVCCTSVAMQEKFPVLYKVQYRAYFNGTPRLHESQFRGAVRLL